MSGHFAKDGVGLARIEEWMREMNDTEMIGTYIEDPERRRQAIYMVGLAIQKGAELPADVRKWIAEGLMKASTGVDFRKAFGIELPAHRPTESAAVFKRDMDRSMNELAIMNAYLDKLFTEGWEISATAPRESRNVCIDETADKLELSRDTVVGVLKKFVPAMFDPELRRLAIELGETEANVLQSVIGVLWDLYGPQSADPTKISQP